MKIARLLVVLPLIACSHRHSERFDDLLRLEAVETTLPTDSTVLARLAREHPCVTRMPRLSRFSESLSTRANCTLMETAIAAIRSLNGAPEVLPDLRQFRVERVQCLTLRQEAARTVITHRIELARWTVDFSSDEQPDVGVSIDRRTGEAHAYAMPPEADFGPIDPCE